MANEKKTIGQAIIDAVTSGNQQAINDSMADIYRAALKAGLRTPEASDVEMMGKRHG